MTRIVCISDTHCAHAQLDLPQGDILIHAGDFTFTGDFDEVDDFVCWLEVQDFEHKVIIAGNHDLSFDAYNSEFNEATKDLLTAHDDPRIHYLENSGVIIDGIKFYGTPWTPWFYDWAFNGQRDEHVPYKDGPALRPFYEDIPKDTEVLVCHGPPFEILDWVPSDQSREGSREMVDIIQRKLHELKLYICGHIHESYGMVNRGGITYVNASSLGRDYTTVQAPIVIDL